MGWSGAGKATTPEKGVGPGKRVNELTLGGKEERIACRRLSARYINTRSPGPTPSRLEVRVRSATVGRAPTAGGQPVDGARKARLCVNTRDCLMQSRRSRSAFQSGYFHAAPLTGFNVGNLTRNESLRKTN
jgi:hypothetical protein